MCFEEDDPFVDDDDYEDDGDVTQEQLIEEDELDRDDSGDDIQFADPGGNSSLRAGPRTERCPNCKFPNRLTVEDVRLGYQCDACANALEHGIDPPYNEDYDGE
jgi:hypothetical protein